MKHGRSQHVYGILAPAARSALRFAVRRNATGWYNAWRPVALFWRRQRRVPQSARAGHMAPAAGAVWLPQFHLHFMRCVHDRPWRCAMPETLSVVTMYPERVVMAYQRTIVQSSLAVAHQRRDQRPEYRSSIRHAGHSSGAKALAALPGANSARRRIVPPIATQACKHKQRSADGLAHRSARNGSGASVQAAAPYTSAARRFVVLPATTWVTDHAQRIAHVFLLPNGGDSDAHTQAVVPPTDPPRRPSPPSATRGAIRAKRSVRVFSLNNTYGDSGTSAQATATYARSARRSSVSPLATWAVDYAHYPKLGRTHVKVRPSTDAQVQDLPAVRISTREPLVFGPRSTYPKQGQMYIEVRPHTDAQAQTLQILRASKRELLVFRPRSTVIGNAVPPYSQESTSPQPHFHPQELVWRRAVPPAAGIAGDERQADPRELTHQPLGRSLPGQATASGVPHSFGRAPAAPALTIDSALMDRLADDVIRRVERRERIERARRGL